MPPIAIPIMILILLCIMPGIGAWYTVRQRTRRPVELFGKYKRAGRPGLNLKIPLLERVRRPVSLAVSQLDVIVNSKTQDDVFVDVTVAVQTQIMPDRVKEAVYDLNDPDRQIKAWVENVVRSRLPKIRLDEVFSEMTALG